MYKRILFPVDLNALETQAKALATAVQLAKSFDAELDIMSVVPDYTMSIVSTYFPEDFEENMMNDAKARLDEYVAKNVPEGMRTRGIVAHGSIYNEILNYADEIDADLIIMASHRPELKDYLVGPNASRVVRHSKCSAMVVRE